MAYTAHHTTTGGVLAAANRLASALAAGLWTAMIAAAENNPRLRHARQLHALSDTELAARGIRREDIVRIAFRDVHFT